MEHCRDTRDKFQFNNYATTDVSRTFLKCNLLFHEKLEYQFYPSGIKNPIWCKLSGVRRP